MGSPYIVRKRAEIVFSSSQQQRFFFSLKNDGGTTFFLASTILNIFTEKYLLTCFRKKNWQRPDFCQQQLIYPFFVGFLWCANKIRSGLRRYFVQISHQLLGRHQMSNFRSKNTCYWFYLQYKSMNRWRIQSFRSKILWKSIDKYREFLPFFIYLCRA